MRVERTETIIAEKTVYETSLCNICERDISNDDGGITIKGALDGYDEDGEKGHNSVSGDVCQKCVNKFILPLLKLPLQIRYGDEDKIRLIATKSSKPAFLFFLHKPI